MATSKYKIAEQAQRILAGGYVSDDDQIAIQELMIAVEQEFARAVKMNWYQNKNMDGVSEINGAFIYSFEDIPVAFNAATNKYYATLPASYIDLPHELGLHYISKMQSQEIPFVRLPNGYGGLLNGLASESMEGFNTYFVENDKIILPTLSNQDTGVLLLLKLAVSLDGIEEDTPINVPPDIQGMIVDGVVKRYMLEKQISNEPEKLG